MQPAQQRLWPDSQPLVERLGRVFFRNLPECAGVYLMRGAGEVVLYVGKAKNLRKRLGSYRVANPERMRPRHLRLLRAVVRIEWQECADELAALAREAELLRTIKPRFNRAGTWSGPKRFLGWRAQSAGVELAILESVDESWSGAGPYGAQVIYLHRALVRLLWCRLNPEAGLAGMPTGWLQGKHGKCVLLSHSTSSLVQEACERLSSLAGTGGTALHDWLLPVAAPFEQPMRDEDLELVTKQLTARFVSAPVKAMLRD